MQWSQRGVTLSAKNIPYGLLVTVWAEFLVSRCLGVELLGARTATLAFGKHSLTLSQGRQAHFHSRQQHWSLGLPQTLTPVLSHRFLLSHAAGGSVVSDCDFNLRQPDG